MINVAAIAFVDTAFLLEFTSVLVASGAVLLRRLRGLKLQIFIAIIPCHGPTPFTIIRLPRLTRCFEVVQPSFAASIQNASRSSDDIGGLSIAPIIPTKMLSR